VRNLRLRQIILCAFALILATALIAAPVQRPPNIVGPWKPGDPVPPDMSGIDAAQKMGLPPARPLKPLPPLLGEKPVRTIPRELTSRVTQPDRNLTSNTPVSNEVDPNWAKASNQEFILFASNGVPDQDGHISADQARANYHIWRMAGDGSLQEEITNPPDGTDDREPAWSPQGNFMAFARKSAGGTWEIYTYSFLSPQVKPQLLTVSNLAGTGDKRHPTWDSGGTRIAYQYRATPTSDWDIYWIPADLSSAAQPVAATDANEIEPVWSPAADVIAYASDEGGAYKIWTVNSDGTSATQRSNGGGTASVNDRQPDYTAGGSRIVFASDRDTGDGSPGDVNVWSMDSSGEVGGAPAVLHSNRFADTATDEHPTYSRPIGSTFPVARIAFSSNRSGATFDIWETASEDIEPPELQELPKVDQRLVPPGGDLVIHVRVTDRENDVAEVRAIFRDPDGYGDDVTDHKIYLAYGPYVPNEGCSDEDEDRFSAMLEWSWERVGEIILAPDPDYGPDDQKGEWFTGTWSTPTSPSDYYIDIYLRDSVGNEITYDTIYGFSTKPFIPQNRILYVDDYGHGQKFFSSEWYLGYWDQWPAGYPTESYFLDNPGATDRGQGAAWSSVWANSIRDGWYGKGYDIWRVICRDKITIGDLSFYLPKVKHQLMPESVIDSDAIVIWNAPRTGHVWTTPNEGSIIASDIQNTLERFLDQGGRLMISGQDIAWALTANGLFQNSFLTDYLHVQFIRDDYAAGLIPNYNETINCSGTGVTFMDGDPWLRPGHIWGTYHYWHISQNEPPSFARTPFQHGTPPEKPRFHDAHWYTVWQDVVQPVGTAQTVYSYPDGSGAAAVLYHDPQKDFWTFYMPMGFEAIHREYHSHDDQKDCQNFRGKIIHNFYCGSNTGTFAGHVGQTQTGGKPIGKPYPIVEIMENRSPGTTVGWAARCDEAGRWIAYGIEPGIHVYRAVRHGFVELQSPQEKSGLVHGGGRDTGLNILLTKTEPGSISGKVTFKGTGVPAGGIPVYAVPALAPEIEESMTAEELAEYQAAFDGWATTGPDGTYIIPNLEVGDYHVSANVEQTVEGQALTGYDPDYSCDPDVRQATVNPSSDTANTNFELVAADGFVVAYVYDIQKRDQGVAQEQVANALVTIKLNGQAAGSGSTGADGKTDPMSVTPSNDYVAVARAPGYKPSGEVAVGAVVSKETTEVEIGLEPEPPGSILGFVSLKSAPDTPVENVTISIVDPVTDAALTSPTGEPLTAVTSATKSFDSVTHSTYNYRIDNVPTGEVKVVASQAGGADHIVLVAEPEYRIVTVTTGLATSGVDFLMSGLHTFPAGVSMVSTPYDYSDRTIGALLGLDTVQAAVWDPSTRQYVFYPDAPADRFRLGQGIWLKFDRAMELSVQGNFAEEPYRIPLSTGWNMIGNPFPRSVDFYSEGVQVEADGQVMSMQQALGSGVLANGLWTYMFGGYRLSSELVPWSGFWVRALRPATLIVHDPSMMSRSTPISDIVNNPRGAFRAPAEGWLVQLTARAGTVEDTSAYIGVSKDASDGADGRYDVPKPPAARMAPFLHIGFPHGDWGARADMYAVDIRSPISGRKSWDLVVQTNLADADVTLTWPDLREMPRGLTMVLEDLDAGTKRYMRTTSGYTFHTSPQPGGSERRFRITVSQGNVGGLAVTELVSTPTKGGAISLGYRLSKTASVTVTVRNIAGRVIRTLAVNEVQGAGPNRLSWDGRNDAGVETPNGTYLCEVRAQTEDGQQVRALRPVMLVR